MRLTRCEKQSWPLARAFHISRGSKSSAEVVVVELEDEGAKGKGECVPYDRYGETCDAVMGQIGAACGQLRSAPGRASLQKIMPPGAARNALDCALWDLDAKKSGLSAYRLAGCDLPPSAVVTAFTLSLMDRRDLEEQALLNASRPLLKLKMGGGNQRGSATR